MRQVNTVMIGTGLMAKIYSDILLQRGDCRLLAVCGNTNESTQQYASRYGVSGYPGGDVAAMFRDHPQAEVTIITTPEWVRKTPLTEAMKCKQHILVEKPFAHDLATAIELTTQFANYSYVVDICHVLRYSPRFFQLKQAIVRGDIGDIRHIYARRNSNRTRVMRVLGQTDLAFWLTPHDVDMMRWLIGSEVTEVFARSRNGLCDEDDYLIANLHFANGVDAVLEISWCTPPVSASAPETRFEVWGTKGSAELSDSDMNVKIFSENSQVFSPDTYEDYVIHGLRQGYFKNMIDSFIDRVKRDDVAGNRISDALAPIQVCDMIRRSIDEHRLIIA
jgi:predicted dehydrogenase